METSKNNRGFSEKIIDCLIIYILPIICVGYVNYTKCWPYEFLKDFYKNTAGEHKQWVNDDIIYFFSVIFVAAIFYGIKYLFQKIF